MSNSCTNNHAINYAIDKSGLVDGEWRMYLLTNEFAPSCEKMLTDAMLPPQCVIGSMPFPVKLDRENVCVVSAVEEVRFSGLGDDVDSVSYIVMMSPVGIAVAIYGTDIIRNLTRIHTSGTDLVVKFGADRAVWGL
jgi:hypothetical protein